MSKMMVRMLTVVPEHNSSTNLSEAKPKFEIDDKHALRSSQVPFRLPSFVSPTALNNHIFEANGEIYEYVDGQYFKRVSMLYKGSSFGDIALQRKCTRTATIKTDTECQFMYLTKDAYQSSLMKIKEDIEQQRVNFIRNLPIFKLFSRKSILKFYWDFKEVKYFRHKVVYDERD